jgi:hypothetical protein
VSIGYALGRLHCLPVHEDADDIVVVGVVVDLI